MGNVMDERDRDTLLGELFSEEAIEKAYPEIVQRFEESAGILHNLSERLRDISDNKKEIPLKDSRQAAADNENLRLGANSQIAIFEGPKEGSYWLIESVNFRVVADGSVGADAAPLAGVNAYVFVGNPDHANVALISRNAGGDSPSYDGPIYVPGGSRLTVVFATAAITDDAWVTIRGRIRREDWSGGLDVPV